MPSVQENTEYHNEKNSSSEFFINLFCRGSRFKKRLEMYAFYRHVQGDFSRFKRKEHHIKDLPMTYRTINHWESQGLIN